MLLLFPHPWQKDPSVESSSLVNVRFPCLSFVIVGFYGVLYGVLIQPAITTVTYSVHCKAVGGAIDWLTNWQIV